MSAFEIAVLITGGIAAALLVAYAKRLQKRNATAHQGPEYIWLAIVGKRSLGFDRVFAEEEKEDDGAPEAESIEGTYEGAYLLLMAGLRMELMVARREKPVEVTIVSRPRVEERVTYTTEAFRPYMDRIKTLDDFGLFAPYREGWSTMMKLSVHPDDVDQAVRVLEGAGLTVERPPGKHWWH